MRERNVRFPNKLVIIGVFFVLVGAVLLLWTAGSLHRFANLWPLLPVLVGLILLYFRLFRSGPDYYIFLATSLLLAGVLFLLTNTAMPVELGRIWPLFMTIIGVALLLYGMRKSGSARVTFIVPGAAMVLLSIIFLPFALELVTVEFASFVAIWWPVLLIMMGVALIFVHTGRNRDG